MQKKNAAGILSVLFSVFVWGISFVSTKVVLNELAPMTIALFRQLIAIIPLLLLMKLNKESFKLDKGEFKTFLIASVFGIVLYFLFENTGLTLTSASNASMLVAAIPVFALIAESIVKKARMELPSLICILSSILGVYFVIFEHGVFDFSSSSFIGNLFVLGAMASWIVYTFISTRLGQKYSSIKMTAVQTLMSIPLFVPFAASEFKQIKLPSLTALLNILFLGIFCSALAYVFYLYGMQKLGPVLPSAFLNLTPVVTVLAGMLFLSEALTLFQFIGAVLIIGSLMLLSFMKLKKPAKKAFEAIPQEGNPVKAEPDSVET